MFTHDSIGLGEDGPDAPARRAHRELAGDAQHARLATLRCGRDGRGLACGDRAAHGADESRADATGPAARRAQRRAASSQIAPRRLRASRLRGRARARPDRYGLGGRGSHSAPPGRTRRPPACPYGSCRCPAWRSSTSSRKSTDARCCRLSGARLAVEAGVADSWWRYLAGRGDVIAMSRFGQSAPAADLFAHYGFTEGSRPSTAAKRLLCRRSRRARQPCFD